MIRLAIGYLLGGICYALAQTAPQTGAIPIVSESGTGGSIASSCWAQTNPDSGSVMFGGGCDLATMDRMSEQAHRQRRANTGDVEEIGRKLDRIIQLLEQR